MRLATSFVLGYHGCDAALAEDVVNGQEQLEYSENEYDWLGPGVYFWESDPSRAMDFARWKQQRGDIDVPAVVGAVIDLRECLDLTTRDDIKVLRRAYDTLMGNPPSSEWALPENKNAQNDPYKDLMFRYRDCAVLSYLHDTLAEAQLPTYDTVRGMFEEGGEAFPGSAIRAKTHTQVAVRNMACIKGYFYPLEEGVLIEF